MLTVARAGVVSVMQNNGSDVSYEVSMWQAQHPFSALSVNFAVVRVKSSGLLPSNTKSTTRK